jgi:hypothetical protein
MGPHIFTKVLLRSDGEMQWIGIVYIGELAIGPVSGEKVSHEGFARDTEVGDATLEEGIVGKVKWRPQRGRGSGQD